MTATTQPLGDPGDLGDDDAPAYDVDHYLRELVGLGIDPARLEPPPPASRRARYDVDHYVQELVRLGIEYASLPARIAPSKAVARLAPEDASRLRDVIATLRCER